jgi:ATP-dependent RNA helicase RhlE
MDFHTSGANTAHSECMIAEVPRFFSHMLFTDLGLIDPILKALQEEGYDKPTPIQAQAIPSILKQNDLLGCAQTGTGKTAAFAIPLLQLLIERRREGATGNHIKALVLTPTRELAIQIDDSFNAYGRHCGLRHTVVFGGVSQHKQTQELRKGIDILTATPGRLLDLIQQKFIDLSHLEFFVLDEADRMLDMGFIHDVKRIISLLPAKRQSLFFSATMPPEIVKLADKILHTPVKVSVTPPSTTAQTIQQSLYYVEHTEKKGLLAHLLNEDNIERALVFTRTKHGANKVAQDLNKKGIRAEAIHGNKSQIARQKALNNFKEKKIRVLVATDIAARGIDVDDLSHVINYEIPNISETYVHRIGRTGRAGADGIAISFCDSEEFPYLKDIQKLIGFEIPLAKGSLPPAEAVFNDAQTEASRNAAPRRPQNNPRHKRPSGNNGGSANGQEARRSNNPNDAGSEPKQRAEGQGRKPGNGNHRNDAGRTERRDAQDRERKAPTTAEASSNKLTQPRHKHKPQANRSQQRASAQESSNGAKKEGSGATEQEKKENWLKKFFNKRH